MPTAEWEGFVFINLARTPEPFEKAWAPLMGRFDRFRLPQLKLHRRIEYDIAANWKLIHQNYSECYHCSMVHPQLVKLTPPTSGENDLFDGPFLGGFMEITQPGGSLTVSGRMCGVPLTDTPADAKQQAWYYSIFPNLLFSLLPGLRAHPHALAGGAGAARSSSASGSSIRRRRRAGSSTWMTPWTSGTR